MTPQERQLVDDLFNRLSQVENTPRDPDAAAAIAQGLRQAPHAVYALVQTVLLQDEALKRADSRIQELEAAGEQQQQQSGGFLDTMREAVFGASPSRGSVPNVRPPEPGRRPVWNSGQTPQQPAPAGFNPASYEQPGYGQPYGTPQAPGGGGSFLGTAAAAAVGVVGGSLLLGSIRSMMGGSHQSFGDQAGHGGGIEDRRPWSDQSGGSLARDAGINDIGSSNDRAGSSRAGLFDSASNDDDDHDDMDLDSDDLGGNDGGDGGSDSA